MHLMISFSSQILDNLKLIKPGLATEISSRLSASNLSLILWAISIGFSLNIFANCIGRLVA